MWNRNMQVAPTERDSGWYLMYLLLFPLGYLIILTNFALAPFVVLGILEISYMLMLFANHKEPILYLILFSRCMNGFVFPHNDMAYTIMNLLTGYVPVGILLLARLPRVELRQIRAKWFGTYKFTTLYIACLAGFALVDIELSSSSLIPRFMPMALFALAVLVLHREFRVDRLLRFMRWISVGMLVAYLLPSYALTTQEYLQDAVVFKQSIDKNQYFVLWEYFRNVGIYWDSRIVGIMAYTFLYLSLRHGGRERIIDCSLAILLMLSSMSRGAIVVGALLLIVHMFGPSSMPILRRLGRVYVLLALFFGVSYVAYQSPVGDYAKSFTALSEGGAFTQRQGFSDYAIDAFKENPLGNGLGYLKSPAKERSVNVGEASYNVVSDAFWAILLGELGIIGFALFILSFIELFWHNDRYAIALFVGLSLQLFGTDIPDMGLFYFAFVLICSRIAVRENAPHLVQVRVGSPQYDLAVERA